MGFVFCRCNVVGYFQKTQPAFDPAKPTLAYPTGILAFQWDKVNGEARKINDILKCSVCGTCYNHNTEDWPTEGWENTAPHLQVRRADGGYTDFYYVDDAWDGQDGVMGWADEDGNFTDDTVTLGQGAWVSCPIEDGVFTIAGAVAGNAVAVGGDSSVATILAGGGFPVAFAVNGENVTWSSENGPLTPGTCYNHNTEDWPTLGWENTAPHLQIRRADGGYTDCYYIDDAWNGQDGTLGWADEDGNLTDFTIGVGGGFWMKNPNDNGRIYVTVANPLAE